MKKIILMFSLFGALTAFSQDTTKIIYKSQPYKIIRKGDTAEVYRGSDSEGYMWIGKPSYSNAKVKTDITLIILALKEEKDVREKKLKTFSNK